MTPRLKSVPARHAATLILVRTTAKGPEILMGVRTGGHRFMPNRLVFPGGAVDPTDATAPAASELRPHVHAMLARKARPPLARALAIAAARELEEETTLSLGTPPQLDAIDYLCRAVTPPSSPIRFNARFLTAPAEAATGTPTDTAELADVRYRLIEDALQQDVVLVTAEVLKRLQTWLTLPPQPRTTLDVFRTRSWGTE